MSAYCFEIKQREFSSSLFQKAKTSFCFRFTETLMKIQVRNLLFSPIIIADYLIILVILVSQALFEVPAVNSAKKQHPLLLFSTSCIICYPCMAAIPSTVAIVQPPTTGHDMNAA